MCKRVFAALLTALLLLCLLCGCQSTADKVDEARKGVVRVLVQDQYGNYGLGSAVGVGKSGEPTYFVTNYHVVSDDYGDVVSHVYILKDSHAVSLTADNKLDPSSLDRSRMIPCDVIYRADNGAPDLAVLRAAEPVSGRICLPIAAAEDTVKAGETVYALGYPASADMTSTTEAGGKLAASVEDITVTNGVVSRITEYGPMENTRIIQHTASINGGNSGGALINEDGYLVGINTFTFNGSGLTSGEQNHYGSVESEYVMDMLDDLRIEYKTGGELPIATIIIIAVAVVAIILVVVIVIVVSHHGKQPAPPPPGPVPVPGGNVNVGGFPGPGPQIPTTPTAGSPSPHGPGFRIQGISGDYTNRRFAVGTGIRIGRDPSRNDLVYAADAKGISGVHCMLTAQGNRLFLQDLGSTYGTYVGGSRLAANQSVELRKGDRFWLGSEQQAFVVDYRG